MLEIWGGKNFWEVGEKVFVVWSCIGVEMLESWGVGALELQDNMCGWSWSCIVVEVLEKSLFRVNHDGIRVQQHACRAMQMEIRGMPVGTHRVL